MKESLQHIKSWGNYLKFRGQLFVPSKEEIHGTINKLDQFIAYGNGKNYGDCAFNNLVISSKQLNKVHHFDTENGTICCESGVLLGDLVKMILPKGYFLQVTPGTKNITIGGAVASDVHGKNHFNKGSFSDHIIKLKLLLPNGNVINCSKEENKAFFYATCGGMGLTGIILEVTFKLKRISGNTMSLKQQKYKTLTAILRAFKNTNEEYAVAWLNTSSAVKNLGCGLFLEASHTNITKNRTKRTKSFVLPKVFPSFLINNLTIKLFNTIKYCFSKSNKQATVAIDSYFYPLDRIANLDVIYGKNGMIQYQFVLPETTAESGIKMVLMHLKKCKFYSFISVLKYHGPANDNWLSFPERGFSLALDFKYKAGLLEFLDELDEIVAMHNGKLYLAKDVRMSPDFFKSTYSNIEKFKAFRQEHDLMKCQSIMSKRLQI